MAFRITIRHRLLGSLIGGVLLAGMCFGSWFLVHTDLQRQNKWIATSRGLIWPVICFGEFLTEVTDSVGIGGREVVVDLGATDPPRTDFAYAGLPRTSQWLFGPNLEVIKNRGYIVGYDESAKLPAWVTYRVFDVDGLYSAQRPSRFKVDGRTYAKVGHDDYTGSGYDRGHMAPNYGIATRYGREAQVETFLMSNIVPQSPELNRRAWKDVEMKVAKAYGQAYDEIWVVTGPIYNHRSNRLEAGVVIPQAFFKVLVDEDDGRIRALAFIFPQEAARKQWPRRHLVSIDAVEKATGLDFFHELPKTIEDKLESQAGTCLWPIPIGLQIKNAFKR